MTLPIPPVADDEAMRPVYRSRDRKTEISTNIPGFRWPTPSEKIDGLLSAGLIDEAQAAELRAALQNREAGDDR